MFKYLFFLFIPFIFTFTLDYLISHPNNLNKDLVVRLPNEIIITEVHSKLDFKSNSFEINNLFSEKFIDKKFIDNSSIINTQKNYLLSREKISKKIIQESVNIKYTSKYSKIFNSNWKNNFSNKKVKFIETVLPLIVYENEKILLERKQLKRIKNFLISNKTLPTKDLKYLKEISKKYNISSKNKHKIDILNELFISVDIIPNAIVLAQAANESGWGTSRFAKEYNALFGQYTYNKNDGVVPYLREEGEKHYIKYFASINKSVESYFNNINSHYAYDKFRKIRSQIHKKNFNYNIKLLTQELDVYAQDEFYVDTINSIIDFNNLNQFDIKVEKFIKS